MAHFAATVESRLPQSEAFAYMADFANTQLWDPGVRSAKRVGDQPIGVGTTFDVVARFVGRDVPLRYTIVEFDAPRLIVLEANGKAFAARDAVTVEPSGEGSTVSYDAGLAFNGVGRLFEPLMQVLFARTGARAIVGMRAALNP
jgi:carbon monoxide dehydrogenase subunit G